MIMIRALEWVPGGEVTSLWNGPWRAEPLRLTEALYGLQERVNITGKEF
jgi:hypothetical protein